MNRGAGGGAHPPMNGIPHSNPMLATFPLPASLSPAPPLLLLPLRHPFLPLCGLALTGVGSATEADKGMSGLGLLRAVRGLLGRLRNMHHAPDGICCTPPPPPSGINCNGISWSHGAGLRAGGRSSSCVSPPAPLSLWHCKAGAPLPLSHPHGAAQHSARAQPRDEATSVRVFTDSFNLTA